MFTFFFKVTTYNESKYVLTSGNSEGNQGVGCWLVLTIHTHYPAANPQSQAVALSTYLMTGLESQLHLYNHMTLGSDLI